MVAPQVSGQGKNDSTWKIVTVKKTKKQAKELFKNEDFPPLPKPSSVTLDSKNDMDTSSGSCGKSVIFPHLVGFHCSRQNIY